MEKISERAPSRHSLTLCFAERQKHRRRLRLDDGTEAALMLPRGTSLRGGDVLRAEDGTVVTVRAAAEELSTARTADALQLARACYHLGNRHVPLQVTDGELRYLRDGVLDTMLTGLGLAVRHECATFEPEAGAYAERHRHA